MSPGFTTLTQRPSWESAMAAYYLPETPSPVRFRKTLKPTKLWRRSLGQWGYSDDWPLGARKDSHMGLLCWPETAGRQLSRRNCLECCISECRFIKTTRQPTHRLLPRPRSTLLRFRTSESPLTSTILKTRCRLIFICSKFLKIHHVIRISFRS